MVEESAHGSGALRLANVLTSIRRLIRHVNRWVEKICGQIKYSSLQRENGRHGETERRPVTKPHRCVRRRVPLGFRGVARDGRPLGIGRQTDAARSFAQDDGEEGRRTSEADAEAERRTSAGADVQTEADLLASRLALLPDHVAPGIPVEDPDVEEGAEPAVVEPEWPEVAVAEVERGEGEPERERRRRQPPVRHVHGAEEEGGARRGRRGQAGRTSARPRPRTGRPSGRGGRRTPPNPGWRWG